MNDMNGARGVECLWGNIKKHPQCSHGPTLLFGRYINGELERFYACSACRDRKLCRFYLKYGQELSKSQKSMWEQEKKKLMRRYPHQKLYIRFNEIKAGSVAKRCYCHNCERLIFSFEKDRHNDHEVTENLTDHQMHHPTELLKPLHNEKREAQYLFSEKSTKDIINMLLKLRAKQILCIGTPRIHEYISEHYTDTMSSLLLDFDGRFHNFFGPLDYCWYNLFNHHFLNEDAINVFKDFITQNEGNDTYVICDPPFGGRVEPMSYTMKTITDLHKKLNNCNNDKFTLKIMFIFPYFMEHIIKEKSNPPSVAGGLRDLKMSDYKVDYDNHPLFTSEKQGRKQSSPIRIFTNIPLKLLELPVSDGYKFCKDCEKWVSSENKHCRRCKECTSKNGRTYRHCRICKRCVKTTWKHCKTCKRCVLEKHICGQGPNIIGNCFKCNKLGHTGKECPNLPLTEATAETDEKGKIIKKHRAESESKTSLIKEGEDGEKKEQKQNKKRKAESELKAPLIKKVRINDLKKIAKRKIRKEFADKKAEKKIIKLGKNGDLQNKKRQLIK